MSQFRSFKLLFSNQSRRTSWWILKQGPNLSSWPRFTFDGNKFWSIYSNYINKKGQDFLQHVKKPTIWSTLPVRPLLKLYNFRMAVFFFSFVLFPFKVLMLYDVSDLFSNKISGERFSGPAVFFRCVTILFLLRVNTSIFFMWK